MSADKIKIIIPFAILFLLCVIFYREIFYSNPNKLSSGLIGEAVPAFKLINLNNEQEFFTQANLKGQVSLLNVWASWCPACSTEHDMLMKIKNEYHVPIYGIAYKDKPEAIHATMTQFGNPYIMMGNDATGDIAIDLGIYGTPETFVINPEGKVIYKHVGVIDQKIWDEVFVPLLQQYGYT